MADILLTIRRKGSFVVNHTGSNANQCGMKGTTILNYAVSLVTSPRHLNKQGFIIDNMAIQQYFVAKYKTVKTFPSCEKLAMIACRDFRDMFSDNSDTADELFGACVIITGAPGAAELECMWVADGHENSARVLMALRPQMSA